MSLVQGTWPDLVKSFESGRAGDRGQKKIMKSKEKEEVGNGQTKITNFFTKSKADLPKKKVTGDEVTGYLLNNPPGHATVVEETPLMRIQDREKDRIKERAAHAAKRIEKVPLAAHREIISIDMDEEPEEQNQMVTPLFPSPTQTETQTKTLGLGQAPWTYLNSGSGFQCRGRPVPLRAQSLAEEKIERGPEVKQGSSFCKGLPI